MNLLNYFLLSILYFWCSSTALSLGIGYYTIFRPIISGMITGFILGDFQTGMLAGAVVNIIYIDFVSTGGSFKGDQCLSAIIAATAAIIFKLTPVEAAAIAYPFGFAGVLLWKYRLDINMIFVRKYDFKYKAGLNPDISLYDGVFPQVLLYAISAVVFVISINLMFLFKNLIFEYYDKAKFVLFVAGIYLINISVVNVMLNLKTKAGIAFFVVSLSATILVNISSAILLLLLLLLLSYLNLNDSSFKFFPVQKYGTKVLSKKDLFISWFIWMNFSHSCYNYERLQGMAFAHSMKNIVKKLYKKNDEIESAIYKYAEFFNTEPNIGTPIHGYIISLEEQKSLGKEIADVSNIKKALMGITAGLGDSFTQVVLSPLFISLSLMMCLDNNFAGAVIPVLILGATIIYISYTGWMNGYYQGREYLINRVSKIKNNKIKKYFPLIFSAIFGVIIGKLLLLNYNFLLNDILYVIFIIPISVIYIIATKYNK